MSEEQLILVQDLIHEIRGKKVMLDSDLARLYGVETRALKQAVRRNITRFPNDFMFELTIEEANNVSSRSQIVTLNESSRGSNTKYKPASCRVCGAKFPPQMYPRRTAIQQKFSRKEASLEINFFIGNKHSVKRVRKEQ